jgi:hypothetical protein
MERALGGERRVADRNSQEISRLVDIFGAELAPLSNLSIVPLSADIYRFPFYSEGRCDELVSLISDWTLTDSQLMSGSNEDYRTSREIRLADLGIDVCDQFNRIAIPHLKKVTKFVWGWEFTSLTDVTILAYGPGTYYKEHVDAADDLLYSLRHISFVIYLSDNCKGGETYFRRQGTSVAPQKGTGIMFPSGITHPHESRVVLAGVKYALVGWVQNRRDKD